MTGTVERLKVEPITPQTPRTVFTPPTTSSEKPSSISVFMDSLLPAFSALAAVLAVRLFLLFAVIGAFILAQTALTGNDPHSMWVLVIYCAFIVLPLVWLDSYGRRK